MAKFRLTIALLALALGACAKAAPAPDAKEVEAQAHGGYVAAINSNDIDKFTAALTDDIVYQSPNEPEIVGKAAVRQWAAGYFEAYETKWEKTSIGFTVSGDWAFERYTYVAQNTDRKTHAVSGDKGKGINIYHHDADGKWRVAIDGWSSDTPPTPPAP
jgi:ketosteroid isomerase-like protein